MTDHDNALTQYLYSEVVAQRWATERDIVDAMHAAMDKLWLELSAEERAWINARGEMKP